MRKGRIACVVIFVLIVLVLSTLFVSLMKTNPPVTTAAAEPSLTLKASPKTASVIADDITLRARTDGYVVYNLTVQSTVSVDYIAFEATNASSWTVEFLNMSGVPLPDSRINSVAGGTNYYVYAMVKVPALTENGTSLTQRIYANASDGNTSSVDVTTTCELFGVEAVPAGPTEPHAIMGTVNHTNGSVADGAFILLINTVTGETSWDTVGTNGASGKSGKYNTDTSQFPKGFTNGDKLKIIANDGTNYGVRTIIADNTTSYQWLNITLDIAGAAVPPGAPRKALASKSGSNDISITWEAATGTIDNYKVYRSPNLNGSGPWTEVNITTSLSVLRTGELSDNNNYSYIVNASNGAGTNTSNIVFKRCQPLIKPANPNINWVSLPYHCGYANIKELALDVNHADNDNYVIKVSFWDASTQSFKDSTWDEFDGWGGSGYPVTPGMAVQLFVKTAQTWAPDANDPYP